MTTTITAIRRYGTKYSIVLACGHKYAANIARIRVDQLYIGKVVTCPREHSNEN